MKKLLSIFISILLFCAVAITVPCFAISSLVQGNLAGHASASGGSGNTTATATGSFTSNTTANNLLVLVVWATGTQIPSSATTFATPTTPGYTWIGAGSAGTGIVSGTAINATVVYYIPDAPAMSSSAVTTVAASCEFASTVNVEFDLLEFQGIKTSSPYTGQNGNATPQSGGTPGIFVSAGILASSGTNLVIIAMSAQGTNIGAGTGFTLGPNATVATIGQVQYISGYPRTTATLSFNGSETKWVLTADVFTEAAAVSTAVPRHKGWVF
jgi:hypothetical protein